MKAPANTQLRGLGSVAQAMIGNTSARFVFSEQKSRCHNPGFDSAAA